MTARPPLAIDLIRSEAEIGTLFGGLATRSDVADLLEIPDRLLTSILYLKKQPLRYRKFQIHKKRGLQKRVISVPPPALAIIQRKLNHVLQIIYRRRRSVHGFVRSRSILTNALQHVGRRWVLNLDLEDFFPSINFGRVRGMFMAPPYSVSPPAATVLAQICCSDNALPQGAPTSPMVSNMVCGRLDGELLALARHHRCHYTRYGDDITLSTRQRDFPSALAEAGSHWVGTHVLIGGALDTAIVHNGFQINKEKTRLQFRDCHQEVTGITVNVFPNVPRQLVREVRSMLYAWRRHGLQAAEQRFHDVYAFGSRRSGSPDPSFPDVLRGKIEFIGMIRGPSDRLYRKLRAQLSQLAPNLNIELSEDAVVVPELAARAAPGLLWKEYYRWYKDLVVHLDIEKDNGDRFGGTAWALRSRILATANHNVTAKMKVNLPAGSVEIQNSVSHALADDGADCALLRIDEPVTQHRGYLPIDATLYDPGEPIAVIGFPTVPQRQPELAIIPGYIETVNRGYSGRIIYYQLNIQAAGGLSGSPVLSRSGRIIGLVVESTFEQVADDVSGREFCHVLPSQYLTEFDLEKI